MEEGVYVVEHHRVYSITNVSPDTPDELTPPAP